MPHSERPSFKSKLPNLGTTIFSKMTALAHKHQAINLSQGFPDFNTPQPLIDRVSHHMNAGHNQYPPMPGVPELKQKIFQKIQELYHADYDPNSEITITAGAAQALHVVISMLIREGDEAIIFEPAYDVYAPTVKLNRGTPRFVTLLPPDYKIDWEAVEANITSRTRLIIINTPHNPSGSIWSPDDLKKLDSLAEKHNLYILSDEVYQHIVYDDRQHESICRYPGLKKRSFAVFSFGKTYHATGWKIGYVLAPEYLTLEFRKIFQYAMFAVSAPMQYALADFLDHKDYYLKLENFYQQKRDFFAKFIDRSRFKRLPCNGTYFQCVDYSDISNQPDTEFVQFLIEEHGVAAIPVSAFYHDHIDRNIIRFCFAKKDETLEKAGQILSNV